MPVDSPYLFGDFDVAEFCLIAFFLFFAGLVFYLRREDRREGYPLEDDLSGRLDHDPEGLFIPAPKTFLLPHGHGERRVPNRGPRDPWPPRARRSARTDGSPIEPVGDPLLANVGPGSWVDRPDHADCTLDGHPRISPLRANQDLHLTVARQDPDPRGMAVVGADGRQAGVVTDLWVDRSEYLVRYLEVLTEGGRRVLAPMTMAEVHRGSRKVTFHALLAHQFEAAPFPAADDRITLKEEDQVVGYFGAGFLYATPDRQEPWL